MSVSARFASVERFYMTNSSEYQAWASMKNRCLNPNNPDYKNYGGRGIAVCPEWCDSFRAFFIDMGPRPKGLTLDRKNNDGNYEPSNCRWTTRYIQRINSRPKPHKFKAVNKDMGIVCYPTNNNAFAKLFKLNRTSVSLCLHGRQDSHRGWEFSFLHQKELHG